MMKLLSIALLIIFVTPVSAQYSVTSVQTATTSVGTINIGSSIDDDGAVDTLDDDSDGDTISDTPEITPTIDKATPKLQEAIGGGENIPEDEVDDDGEDISASSDESEYNESDLDFINRLIESKAVFIKLGDIKGESSDASSDGNPDRPIVTGNIPDDGESSPDIVIKGKKILENDNVPELLENAPDIEDIDTRVDIALFGAGIASDNERLDEIRISSSEVEIDYEHGLKLFGFLKVTMPTTAVISFGNDGEENMSDEYGRVKVKFPWWHVLGRKTVKPADISTAYDDRVATNLDLQNILQKQAQGLQTLSSILKNIHDPGITNLE